MYVDSDWASGWSRKSTSGGMMTVDGVGVKHWSRTQKARALSSGEAEYYAMVTGCAEGLGLQSLAEDLGWKTEVQLWTDSSAAKAISNRRGLGKLRHVELKWLWVQDVVKEGRVKLRTVKGTGAEARRVSVSFLLLESACFRRVDSCRTVICPDIESE